MSKLKNILNDINNNGLDNEPLKTVALHLTKHQIINYLQKETDYYLIEQWSRVLIKILDEE